eukprot:gene15872-22004_t
MALTLKLSFWLFDLLLTLRNSSEEKLMGLVHAESAPVVCLLCPVKSRDMAGASSVAECLGCGAGKTSTAGGACADVVIPAIDLTIQRDARFEFLGTDCTSFLGGAATTIANFNRTITGKINDASICNAVWSYLFTCGSIVTDNRLTYPAGTSAGDMDGDVQTLVDNAGAVFGDLSEFGITGVRGQALNADDDDDDNSLAIGLGVGLGVGIPLIAGIIFFCIWRKRRSEQNVAPAASS